LYLLHIDDRGSLPSLVYPSDCGCHCFQHLLIERRADIDRQKQIATLALSRIVFFVQFGLFILYPLAFPWLFMTLLRQRKKRLASTKPKAS
jgi:hypothetical protein